MLNSLFSFMPLLYIFLTIDLPSLKLISLFLDQAVALLISNVRNILVHPYNFIFDVYY